MVEKMKLFIECQVPIKHCNFKCDYCYVPAQKNIDKRKPDFSLCLNNLNAAFSKSRLGGVCMINLCAFGETLLYEEMIQVIKGLLECGHYVMVVTNGSLTDRFKSLCEFDLSLRKRLFLKFSFHYLELKNKGLLTTFFDNVRHVKEKHISFTVEITPDDSYVPFIDEIKDCCMQNLGALCHVTVCRDERKSNYPLLSSMSFDKFVSKWKDFDSELFNFKSSIFGVKRKEFCYAGKWSMVLDLCSGQYRQCYFGNDLGNFYKEIEKKPKLHPIGNNCASGHCYNGHAFLGFGLIPGLDSSSYADMRDRTCNDGTNWLSQDMREFMEGKLYESNSQFKLCSKVVANMKSRNIFGKVYRKLKGLCFKKHGK